MLQNAWSKHSPQPPPQSDTMMFGWCFFCFRFILHPELTINSAKAECAIYMKKAPTNCNGIVLKIILNVCVTLHKNHFNSTKKMQNSECLCVNFLLNRRSQIQSCWPEEVTIATALVVSVGSCIRYELKDCVLDIWCIINSWGTKNTVICISKQRILRCKLI